MPNQCTNSLSIQCHAYVRYHSAELLIASRKHVGCCPCLILRFNHSLIISRLSSRYRLLSHAMLIVPHNAAPNSHSRCQSWLCPSQCATIATSSTPMPSPLATSAHPRRPGTAAQSPPWSPAAWPTAAWCPPAADPRLAPPGGGDSNSHMLNPSDTRHYWICSQGSVAPGRRLFALELNPEA